MSETEQAGPSTLGSSAAAVGVALAGADREEANTFLRKQSALTDLLMDEIKDESPLKLSHLRIRRFGDYAKMGFEISVGLLVLALVAGISLMVWNAAHSEGLIIESFSVPPSLEARGVSGQVIASQMLDKLTTMQNDTKSGRPAKSYASNWGDDLKVEIPDTGMSVGELYRFLRRWLGNETHISGEVTTTPTGLAITARAGGNPGATFIGAESGLDGIVQQAAEHVYRSTQPYRYGVFLSSHGRNAEALTLFKAMSAKGPAQERSWAYNGMVTADTLNLHVQERLHLLQQAIALAPDNFVAQNNLLTGYNLLGRTEESYQLRKQLYALTHDSAAQIVLDNSLGAFRESDSLLTGLISAGNAGFGNPYNVLVNLQISGHDLGEARRNFSSVNSAALPPDLVANSISTLKRLFAVAAEDWAGVIAETEAAAPLRRKYPGLREGELTSGTPLVAYARAMLGDIAGAEKLIATTPGDCYPCLRMRARIAQQAKQYGRSDYWFDRSVAAAPSIPFAYEEWGRALLERGQPDKAIAQFELANGKGPHFADPLEGWGEALMAKNQSHLALKKFAEAEKYAPNWGRLHLKWGEALAYSGNKKEAAKQFSRAAQLDLTPSEKTELTRGIGSAQ